MADCKFNISWQQIPINLNPDYEFQYKYLLRTVTENFWNCENAVFL